MAEYRLDQTLDDAIEKFQQKSPDIMAELSECEYNSAEQYFLVPFLGENYKVTYPEGQVTLLNSDQEVEIRTKILILHYLYYAQGMKVQDKLISFKELPNGAIYIEPFTKRAINPMLQTFAEKLEDFKALSQAVGGVLGSLGDCSVTIPIFPRVPITYVIWQADDEFAATGNILFDASASSYLPTEDYAVGASQVIWSLKAKMK